ncbi:uncharacterized protein LOC132882809 isoform X2 [Neoarius graeffei]|uniref:uncharacterized protein LOC132882809 isoform X2 n=1 Tax=Neoarius graeffei TaxID=443677 RepID=UPI00298C7336|nr:uncharacterized protein LOC132882809 isoform X2 [Neoarius graeffei]
MFSCSSSLLLVLLILQCSKTCNNEVMTRFCLSTDTHSQTVKATTCAPQQEYTEEQQQQHTPTSQESSRPSPEECCVHFSFTLPSSNPSTSHEETRVDCRERVVMVKTITSLCEDHTTEWKQKVINAHDWCLMKAPKTTEDCCYLFSQTPVLVFPTQEEKTSTVCEQISFRVTLQTDCTRTHTSLAYGFIRSTYNCLKWAFRDN